MSRRLDRPFVRSALQPLALVAGLVACGGGDSGNTPAPPGPSSVAITQPAAFASALTGVVAVQATATDPSVASVEFQIDGIELSVDAAPPFGATVDSNAFASGQHVLRA